MTTETDGNGAVYVPFGDHESDVLSLAHASKLLRLFSEKQPALFASYVGEAFTGTRPKGPTAAQQR
jgi:hypothetical protein